MLDTSFYLYLLLQKLEWINVKIKIYLIRKYNI